MAEKQSFKVLVFIILGLLGLINFLLFLFITYKQGLLPVAGRIKDVLG